MQDMQKICKICISDDMLNMQKICKKICNQYVKSYAKYAQYVIEINMQNMHNNMQINMQNM